MPLNKNPNPNVRSWLLVLFILASLNGFSNIFVVSSTDDTGPGTLRNAIEQANQNIPGVGDTIVFNLPSGTVAQRTIILLSALPGLTSNLVIDGSTQPGTSFGVSNAKVRIIAKYSAGNTQKLINITGCSNIEIYGLKLDNQITWTSWYPDCRCISIYNSKNIQIGSPGKGNLIINWTQAIESLYSVYEKLICENISIYSNILGIEEDGSTAANNFHQISLNGIKNFSIGNLDPLSGNVMSAAGRRLIFTNTEGTALVAHNKIGCDFTGTKELSLPYGEGAQRHDNIGFISSIFIGEGNQKTDISIINNLSTGTCGSGIAIQGYKRPFLIQGNKIGTDITGTKKLNGEGMDYGIRIESCINGLIGIKPGESTGANIVAFSRRVTGAETWVAGSGIGIINSTYKITISKNSIFCNQLAGITIADGSGIKPRANINNITANAVYGTAPPLSRIELFYDDSCQNCEGKIFFDSTYADKNGIWSKENINTSGIVATATDTTGMTSEFSGAYFLPEALNKKNETCGKKNGTITGYRIISGTTWRWENERGEIVGRDTNLYNVPMGKYRLIVGIGNNSCEAYTDFMEIENIKIPNKLDFSIIPSSCGQPNGSISFDFDEYFFAGILQNAAGDSLGSGSSFNSLFPGTYYYNLYTIGDKGCFKKFGPYIVQNTSGPTMDLSKIQITHASCYKANGNIKGITAKNITGQVYLLWEDSLKRPFANGWDLNNAPAGRYRLKLKDESSCDSIFSEYFSIRNNGVIEIDTTQLLIEKANCISGLGSVTKILTTGADKFKWQKIPNQQVVSQNRDLLNAEPGSYQLTVSNTWGCEKILPVYTIVRAAFDTLKVLKFEKTDALCESNIGSIRIMTFSKDSNNYKFYWVNDVFTQQQFPGASISKLKPGTYQLFAKDRYGCEEKIFSTTVVSIPKPTIDLSQMKITEDNCNMGSGKIEGIKVNGLTGPTDYNWYQNNQSVGNSVMLNGGAGSYILRIRDAGICEIETPPIIIGNREVIIEAPAYPLISVPRFTAATIQHAQSYPGTGTFSLFETPNSANPLQKNNSGIFHFNKIASDTSFYIQYAYGSCTSELSKARIRVIDESYFLVPTAFTPNNDGKNDQLSLIVVGLVDLQFFKIFDRWGKVVFQTSQATNKWDGSAKNYPLPSGAYQWIAQGTDFFGNYIKGNGSVMLIR